MMSDFFEKRLTKSDCECIMKIEKGKTSNGYAKFELRGSPDLTCGGYLTFCVSTIKKITVSKNTFNVYFFIAATSFPNH